MNRITFFLIALFVVTFSNTSYAQCCAAGNPSSGDGGGGIGKNKLSLALNHRYSFSDTYYKGTEKIEYVYLQESDFHFSSVNSKYGITDKLTATLELGYFESKTKTFNDIKSKAFGLGDAVIGLQYGFKLSEGLSIQPNVNVTLPIGTFDFIDDGVYLGIDFQPSAGSFHFGGGFSVNYIYKNARWRSSVFANMNYSNPVQSDLIKYHKYANLYQTGFSTSYRIWRMLNISVLTKYTYRGNAINKSFSGNTTILKSTGGQLLFLSPKVSYSFGASWNVNLGADLPIYKNMNGRQLTNAYMLSGGISKTLNFNQTDSASIAEAMNKQHLLTEIKISGTCKACQMTIEKIANAQKGVITATWSVKTHVLEIHHTDKFKLEKLLSKLAKVDHVKESEPSTKSVNTGLLNHSF